MYRIVNINCNITLDVVICFAIYTHVGKSYSSSEKSKGSLKKWRKKNSGYSCWFLKRGLGKAGGGGVT